MSVKAEADKHAQQRLAKLLEDTKDAAPKKRRRLLEQELAAARAATEIALLESYTYYQDGNTVDVMGRPGDDGNEAWDEVGLFGRSPAGRKSRRYPTWRDLDAAREIGRWLAEENEFVIGSMTNRVSYIVGGGLDWEVKLKPGMAKTSEHSRLIRDATDALEAFRVAEKMALVEQEFVTRCDRDGEALPRTFCNPDGPLRVRYLEPEFLKPPKEIDESLPARARHALALGVETDPQDVQTVYGYHVAEFEELEPVFVPRQVDGVDWLNVYHGKLNVDMASPHGWPTYWPIRQNMSRSEKLLRNMSWVAALQAAIALIRKHENRTSAEVQALLSRNSDATVTDRGTGRSVEHTKLHPGKVIDAPKGTSYETPVSSVNAANNVQVLSAELRGGAVSVVQPTYMFSGDASGGYANHLVTDGPPSKNFKRLQVVVGTTLHPLNEAGLRNEIFWGRLDPATLHVCRLVPKFPVVVVRDLLQETQRGQILVNSGAMSLRTLREREDLDHETEKAQIAEEVKSGELVRGDASQGAKPPPGSTPGGPGGSDMRGNPDSPETTAAGQRF